jgi:hypothetical protein
VIVKKVNGKLEAQDGFNADLSAGDDAWTGSLVGSLIGILGGPIGILLGGSVGMMIGGAVDASDAAKNASLIEKAGDCITEGEFDRFMKENPGRVMDIMKRLCHKLRNTTAAYVALCKDVESTVGTDEVDESKHYGFENNDNLAAVHDGQEA